MKKSVKDRASCWAHVQIIQKDTAWVSPNTFSHLLAEGIHGALQADWQ
jgi:hypothetical protein